MELKEAIRILVKDENLGDFIYNVRERANESGRFKGNSWDHPRVKRFSDAVTRLEEELKK